MKHDIVQCRSGDYMGPLTGQFNDLDTQVSRFSLFFCTLVTSCNESSQCDSDNIQIFQIISFPIRINNTLDVFLTDS